MDLFEWLIRMTSRNTPSQGTHVVGWKLGEHDRAKPLERFAQMFAQTVADHVTLQAKVAADTQRPDDLPAAIVGHVSDHEGVEAIVVAIAGSTDRPDGSTYHITWSLAPGYRAQQSNDVIATHGWVPLDVPIPVALIPAVFR